MKPHFLTLAAVLGVAGLSGADFVQAAPPKGATNSEDLKKAGEALQEDYKQFVEAQKMLAQAQASVKAANQNLAAAKEKAEAAQERTFGLDKLLLEQKAAKKDLKDGSEPVLEELRKTPQWAEAKKRADGAKNKVAGKTGGTTAAQDSMAVTLLERDTIENDARTKPLKQKVQEADKAVLEARAKIKAAIPSDNDVKTAELEVEKYKGELRQAQQYVGQILQKAGYDQAVLNREQQEAHLMQLMSRMKSGGKGGKGRKK